MREELETKVGLYIDDFELVDDIKSRGFEVQTENLVDTTIRSMYELIVLDGEEEVVSCVINSELTGTMIEEVR